MDEWIAKLLGCLAIDWCALIGATSLLSYGRPTELLVTLGRSVRVAAWQRQNPAPPSRQHRDHLGASRASRSWIYVGPR